MKYFTFILMCCALSNTSLSQLEWLKESLFEQPSYLYHSELSILKNPDQPTIYDITISPLTSGVHDASRELNMLRQTESASSNITHNFRIKW